MVVVLSKVAEEGCLALGYKKGRLLGAIIKLQRSSFSTLTTTTPLYVLLYHPNRWMVCRGRQRWRSVLCQWTDLAQWDWAQNFEGGQTSTQWRRLGLAQ